MITEKELDSRGKIITIEGLPLVITEGPWGSTHYCLSATVPGYQRDGLLEHHESYAKHMDQARKHGAEDFNNIRGVKYFPWLTE